MVSHESLKQNRGRKRSSETFDTIKKIVKDNADAERETILAKIHEAIEIADNTALAYFYKAKKALGIKTEHARRGRKPTGVQDKVKKIVQDNLDKERDAVVNLILETVDIAKNTALVYFYKFKKELSQ